MTIAAHPHQKMGRPCGSTAPARPFPPEELGRGVDGAGEEDADGSADGEAEPGAAAADEVGVEGGATTSAPGDDEGSEGALDATDDCATAAPSRLATTTTTSATRAAQAPAPTAITTRRERPADGDGGAIAADPPASAAAATSNVARSSIVANRSSRAFDRARITTREIGSGTRGLAVEGGGGARERISAARWTG